MRTLEEWAIEMEISAWSADGLFSREVVEFIEAIRREAIEAAAKACDRRVMGDHNREDAEAKRCAADVRALLPPASTDNKGESA